MNTDEAKYNVVCLECGAVWTPTARSPLWWQARRLAQTGRLDALHVSGKKCGCVPKLPTNKEPFQVFGYNDQCQDFNIGFSSFVQAVKKFRELSENFMLTVFISGISKTVESRLKFR